MLILILSLLAAGSAGLHIWAEYHGPQYQIYIFKPLTMVFILLLAVFRARKQRAFYASAIIAGLLCSITGDILLMLPSDQFVAGLVSFLAVGYWFYTTKNEPEEFSIQQLVVLFLHAVVVIGVMLPVTLGSFMTSPAGDWFSPMIQIVMMLGALTPQIQIAQKPNKWWLPVAAWVATAILLVVALIV